MSWFPLPASPEDLELLDPHADWTCDRVYALLHGAERREWREKVGVVGPIDGSAKSTTRLLGSAGWVLKTRTDELWESREVAWARAEEARARGARVGAWHPRKCFALMKVTQGWCVLTVCPELRTLRQVSRLDERFAVWREMLQLSIDVQRRHGLGLDVNPANFGREFVQGSPLFYLDDEFYPCLAERELAGAIVARMPEEPESEPSDWAAWGELLVSELELFALSWERIADEVRRYPLPERFEPFRQALLEGWSKRAAGSATRASTARALRRTCVFADVHANRAALEAVLADARVRGADSFLFLGDAVGYGPEPSECIQLLSELENATLIRGNHDHGIGHGDLGTGMNRLARRCAEWTRDVLTASELAWLSDLPVDHADLGWLAVHGAPKDPRRFLAYVYELTYEDNLHHLKAHDIPVCFYGHTHVQLTHAALPSGFVKLPGAQTITLDPRHRYLINPGSVGQPRDGDARAAYALWDRRSQQVHTLRVAYDLEHTIKAAQERGLPPEVEQRLRGGS